MYNAISLLVFKSITIFFLAYEATQFCAGILAPELGLETELDQFFYILMFMAMFYLLSKVSSSDIRPDHYDDDVAEK